MEGRVLQGGYPGIGWKSIQEHNFEEGLDIRKKSHHVIQKLTGELVSDGARLT